MYAMNMLNTNNKAWAILIIIIVFSLMTGCSKIFGNLKENQSKQNQDQRKSPPKTLTSLENTTESMYKDIQEVIDKRAEEQQQDEQKTDKQQEQQQQDQQQSDQQQNNASTEEKPQQDDQKDKQGSQNKGQEEKSDNKQDKPIDIDWNNMKKNVEKLQNSWSHYASVAIKDGASNEIIKEFENQLDLVTTKVMEMQEESLLSAVNDLYKFYPNFLDLYKHQAPPNLKTMKYHIRRIMIESEDNKWVQSNKSLESIKQAWETAKARMKKPDQDMNQKVQTAIDSFSRSVQQKNKHLIKLKGEILISILEEIK